MFSSWSEKIIIPEVLNYSTKSNSVNNNSNNNENSQNKSDNNSSSNPNSLLGWATKSASLTSILKQTKDFVSGSLEIMQNSDDEEDDEYDNSKKQEKKLQLQPQTLESKRNKKIEIIRSSPSSYDIPSQSNLDQFHQFLEKFEFNERIREEQQIALSESNEMKELFNKLVPEIITGEEFWQRYFFRLSLLEKEEEKLKKILTSNHEDEEIKWEESDVQVENNNNVNNNNSDHNINSNSSNVSDNKLKYEPIYDTAKVNSNSSDEWITVQENKNLKEKVKIAQNHSDEEWSEWQ